MPQSSSTAMQETRMVQLAGANQPRTHLSNRMKDRITITSLEAKRQQQNSTSFHDENSQKSVYRRNMNRNMNFIKTRYKEPTINVIFNCE